MKKAMKQDMKKAKRATGPVECMLGRRVIRHSPPSLELGGAIDAKAIADEMLREQRAKGANKGDAAAQKEMGDLATKAVAAYFGLGV